MNTLSDGVITVTLPDDLDWPNEFAWAKVQQAKAYSLTGALLVENGVKKKGRPIELRGGDDFAWMPRSDVEQLRAWCDEDAPGLTLTLRDVEYDVLPDYEAGCIEARPVVDFNNPEADDHYVVVLRFLVV